MSAPPRSAAHRGAAEQRRGPWQRAADARLAPVVPAVLVTLAMPLVRPNLLGESGSIVGFGLLVLAAGAALAVHAAPGARPMRGWPGVAPAVVLVGCLGLGYLWLVLRAAATEPRALGVPALQGLVLTVGALLALLVVLAEPRTRLAVGRAFVGVVVVLCASYVVTVAVWAVGGVGTGAVASFPVGTVAEPQPFYFPFTPTLGVQDVLGVTLPRFTGLGREPGWMAMYCAATWFLTDSVGWRSRWIKVLLLAGLLGCVSTAGFGVFVIAWTYHVFLRDRATGISVAGYARHLTGLAAMGAAVWVAVAAPVLGLAAKTTQNATSLDERQLATEAGIRALTTNPLGGLPTEVQGGINLISDIAVDGLPFVVLATAALLLPACYHRSPARFSNGVVVTVFLTLLVSQPARDSTWAFALVAIAATLRGPDMEQLVPTRPGRTP